MRVSLKNRIAKLENAIMPPMVRRLITFSHQHGCDGEVIRDETDAQAIERHLKEHPEDAGMKFDFINIVSYGDTKP